MSGHGGVQKASGGQQARAPTLGHRQEVLGQSLNACTGVERLSSGHESASCCLQFDSSDRGTGVMFFGALRHRVLRGFSCRRWRGRSRRSWRERSRRRAPAAGAAPTTGGTTAPAASAMCAAMAAMPRRWRERGRRRRGRCSQPNISCQSCRDGELVGRAIRWRSASDVAAMLSPAGGAHGNFGAPEEWPTEVEMPGPLGSHYRQSADTLETAIARVARGAGGASAKVGPLGPHLDEGLPDGTFGGFCLP